MEREQQNRTRIRVSERAFNTEPAPWIFFCTLMIHEWGHAVGREHTQDRTNVMYPKVSVLNYQYAACAAREPS